MSRSKKLSTKTRVILIISLVLVACIVLAVGIYYFAVSRALGRFYEPDLIISSPDGQHELVIREWTCLGGSGADIYIRETKWYNSWIKTKIGSAAPDDSFLPFSHGTYYVEWESDKVTIHYYKNLSAEKWDDRSTWLGIVSYDLD